MAIDQKWCHLHSQTADKCKYSLCELRANDPSYASFASESSVIDESTFGEMDQGSVGLHEIFTSNLSAGFSPEQSIYLVAAMVTGSPGSQPPGVDDDS